MARRPSKKKTRLLLTSALLLFSGIAAIRSCSKPQQPTISKQSGQETIFTQIDARLDRLESRINERASSGSKNDFKATYGPIKSITFRIGSEDDRLRIYWSDGSKSDLPCTKEQSIWACG